MQPQPRPIRALARVSRHRPPSPNRALSRNIFTSFTYALHPSLHTARHAVNIYPCAESQSRQSPCNYSSYLRPCFAQSIPSYKHASLVHILSSSHRYALIIPAISASASAILPPFRSLNARSSVPAVYRRCDPNEPVGHQQPCQSMRTDTEARNSPI